MKSAAKSAPEGSSDAGPRASGAGGSGHQSLAARAYAAIKHRIITLEYRPGQYLNESAVCADLGFTRMPVHQALHRLQLEGLVDIIPRKGVIVRSDSFNEMLDIMDTRLLVEPHCCALATKWATKAQIEEMVGIVTESRGKLSMREMDEFMRLDQAFHRAIIAAARNRVLGDVVTGLHDRSARIWYFHLWSDDDFQRTQSEHEDILAAVTKGDAAAASSAMHRHITSLRGRMARMFQR